MLSGEKQGAHSFASFRMPEESFGGLDCETTARLVAGSSDIAMVLDREGVIRDISISAPDMPLDGFTDIINRRWIDTVTIESRPKVTQMLLDAQGMRASRWREINHLSSRGSLAFRYMAMETSRDGRVVAFGRDLRGIEALQQRLLQAQQAMERDYSRLRQAESRYRVLFQIASEAVLIIDPQTKRVIEANPAAGALLGVDYSSLPGKSVLKLFHAEARDTVFSVLMDPGAPARGEPTPIRLADGRDGFTVTASPFRHDGTAQVLLSLTATKAESAPSSDEAQRRLTRAINRLPDAFVITDEALGILDANLAFLELAQLSTVETARGQQLSRFLGRPNVDVKVLMGNLRDHGWVRNFSTVITTSFGENESVELSAVSVREGLETSHAFAIRRARAPMTSVSTNSRELPRTAEQLTQLVGRVSLREIVAETTDVIERMCIEAALNRTGNNRVSAAEVLGLSRQSLYSKLNRHGIGSSDVDHAADD